MGSDRDDFVHLHVHSEYSLLDGMIRLPHLIEETLSLGYNSIALTDHGGVYGLVPFYRRAVAAGLHPVLGAELYLEAPDGESPYHLPILAENNEGYRNLLRLVTKGQLDGFHKKPVVKREWLAAYSSGLIALSGCLQGEIPRLIRKKGGGTGREAVIRTAGEMKEIFGPDGFFLELQYHGLPEEKQVNRELLELAKSVSLKYVVTNDCHYLKKEDAAAHDLLLAVQTLSTLQDQDRLSLKNKEYYLKSPREMKALFSGLPEALINTVKIAGRCRVKLEFDRLYLPEFPVPEGFTLESYLIHLTKEGLRRRFSTPSKQVLNRLEHELFVINGRGLAGYFLIAWDLVSFARREGIPVGPGRGSGVGSLVAYLLGITQVDPLKYGLLFERFLNPERKGLPDLDIDLCHRGRARVLEYLRRRYGREHVAHLGAFVTLRPRAVIRDVGRALGIAYHKIDRAAKSVPYYSAGIDKALADSPRLKEMAGEDPEIAAILDYARRLEGLPRHMTQHAAGMVITPRPLTDYLALQKAGGEEIITQAEMNTVEELGLLKLDLLGLRYLTVISETLEFLRARGIFLTEEGIPLDDKETFQAIAVGDTIGTFQLESGGMRKLLRRYNPRNLKDIIAILALFRPGPLNSGMVDVFIRRRHGREKVNYLHPSLRPVLEDTYGVILYQEQVMETARVMAGFSLGEADLLRRAITKRNPEALREGREAFVAGAVNRGVDKETAVAVFDLIQEFGHYGFAKAHSAAYALTSYRTVYLKTHYPVEYYAALLSLNWGVADRFPRYLSEVRRKGIKVLLPDINRSGAMFLPEGRAIRAGLICIRDLGTKGLRVILNEREENGPFLSLGDFADRLSGGGSRHTSGKQGLKEGKYGKHSLTKKAADNLIRVGAFSQFGTRPELLLLLRDLWARPCRLRRDPAQGTLFRPQAGEETGADCRLPEYPEKVRLNLERELLGYYFTKHPLEIAAAEQTGLSITTVEELAEEEKDGECRKPFLFCGLVDGVRGHRTRKGERMYFATLEDLTGLVDLVFFPKVLSKCGYLLADRGPHLVWGRPDRTEEQVSLVVEGMRPLAEVKKVSRARPQ